MPCKSPSLHPDHGGTTMPIDAPAGERINSWKDISAYLGRDVSTVIRWEKEKGLPVHRIPGGTRGAVFAFRDELDGWLMGRERATVTAQNPTVDNGLSAMAAVAIAPTPLVDRSGEIGPATGTGTRWKRASPWAVGITLALLVIATAYGYLRAGRLSGTPQLGNQQQLTADGLEKRGLFTDGKTLYFAEDHNGHFGLAAMSVSGGPIRFLWSPPEDVFPLDLSPDGKKLLALTEVGQNYDAELWVVPLDREAPHRLSNIKAHAAAWSPDSKSIAYSTGTAISLIFETDAVPRELGSFTGLPIALEWSQDGQSLRFILEDLQSDRARGWGQISGDGMRTTTLHSLPASMSEGRFWAQTAEGDAFYTPGKPSIQSNGALWLLRYGNKWWEQALQAVPLGSVAGETHGISFSRKSSRVFVLSEPYSQPAFISFDSDAHSLRRILPDASGWFLDYSRDGKWLTYTGDEGRGIFVSRADGNGTRQLVSGPELVGLPRWSPDRRQIAYMSQRPDHPWRIYILQLDSGAVREASEGSDSQGAPTWSPDGRSLVYGSVNCRYTLSCGIHRIDLATGKVRSLPDSDGLYTARWSPDGRFIAALGVDQRQLMLFDVKSAIWHKLADAIDGEDLSWSADSKYLYATVGGPDAQIVRVRVLDGKREKVVDFRSQDIRDLAGTDDLRFSLAPDDTVILHRRIHSEEIYAYEMWEK
jgi:Tol biopolymer transport system component